MKRIVIWILLAGLMAFAGTNEVHIPNIWDNNSFGQGADKFGIFNRFNNMEVEAPWVLNGIKEA